MHDPRADSGLHEVLRRADRRGGPPSVLERVLAAIRLGRLVTIARSMPDTIDALRLDLAERGKVAKDRIEDIIEGAATAMPGTPVLLYAHYMRSGRVTPMIHRQLATYAELGFEIVFVTMSKRLDPGDVAQLRSRCALVVQRRSFGRDFGAWADLWPEVRRRFPDSSEILLANDSVLGPIAPLDSLFERLRRQDGVIGLTESFEHVPHLQSYFMLLRGGAAIAAFDAFFGSLVLSANKRRMVQRGELGVARYLSARGIPMLAAYPLEVLETMALRDPLSRAVIASIFPGSRSPDGFLDGHPHEITPDELFRVRQYFFAHPVNPTHFMWSALVRLMGFPFIKTELLATNPSEVTDVADWKSIIPENSPTPIMEIKEHVTELSRPAPPPASVTGTRD